MNDSAIYSTTVLRDLSPHFATREIAQRSGPECVCQKKVLSMNLSWLKCSLYLQWFCIGRGRGAKMNIKYLNTEPSNLKTAIQYNVSRKDIIKTKWIVIRIRKIFTIYPRTLVHFTHSHHFRKQWPEWYFRTLTSSPSSLSLNKNPIMHVPLEKKDTHTHTHTHTHTLLQYWRYGDIK